MTLAIIHITHIPKPKIKQQIRKPGREKSILYTISMTIMHPPATIKCLGEEKTMCNLQHIESNNDQTWSIWNDLKILSKTFPSVGQNCIEKLWYIPLFRDTIDIEYQDYSKKNGAQKSPSGKWHLIAGTWRWSLSAPKNQQEKLQVKEKVGEGK